MYIIKSRKEMKDAIDMDRKYYDTQNDLFMKRTNDHLVQIKKYMYCLRHDLSRGCRGCKGQLQEDAGEWLL